MQNVERPVTKNKERVMIEIPCQFKPSCAKNIILIELSFPYISKHSVLEEPTN